MSAQQYNLLYAIYSWTNAVVVLFSGFFIDRVGNMIGALVFTFFCFLGASVFAFGSTIENSTLMMVCMLGGRLLFGAGIIKRGSILSPSLPPSVFYDPQLQIICCYIAGATGDHKRFMLTKLGGGGGHNRSRKNNLPMKEVQKD